MAGRGALQYMRGLIVESVREIEDRVDVFFVRQVDGTRGKLSFDRVFIGAGAINSTRIAMRSLGLYGDAIRLNDSQKFVVPFLRLSGDPIQWPRMNTLASLFIEAKLPSLSDHWIHVQVSAVNDLVLKRFKVGPDSDSKIRRALLHPILSRLMVAWCSLHSDHSSQLELTLVDPECSGHPVLQIKNAINPQTKQHMRMAAWALARSGVGFRALFLVPFMAASLPGAGCHYGGSFQMGKEGGSDLLGRPRGMKRTHLVDASTFPSIPATTIVLTIMANADRIATEVPIES